MSLKYHGFFQSSKIIKVSYNDILKTTIDKVFVFQIVPVPRFVKVPNLIKVPISES